MSFHVVLLEKKTPRSPDQNFVFVASTKEKIQLSQHDVSFVFNRRIYVVIKHKGHVNIVCYTDVQCVNIAT